MALVVGILHLLLPCFKTVGKMSEDSSMQRCFCGITKRNTPWTDSNPGRRFWGCERYPSRLDNECDFFRWYDSPMCARSKKIIPGLLQMIRELEGRIEDEMHHEFEMSGSVDSNVRRRSNFEGEVSSLLRNNGSMMGSVRWVILVMLILIVGVYIGSLL